MDSFLAPFSCWEGPRNPKLLIVGEAFGESEDTLKKPFVGNTGKELWRMLGEAAPTIDPQEHNAVTALHNYDLAWVPHRKAWLDAAGIAFTNVLNHRPPNNSIPAISLRKQDLPPTYPSLPAISKGLYLHPTFLPHLDRLEQEISHSNPNLILAAGNVACWALLHSTNISSIRGTTTLTIEKFGSRKVLPTYHPAYLFRSWKDRPVVLADLIKALYEAQFPEIRRPPRNLIINPTIEEFSNWVNDTISNPPSFLSVDTETTAGMIDTISFARSNVDGIAAQLGPHRIKIGTHYELVYPERDNQKVLHYYSLEDEVAFWRLAIRILQSPIPKLGQNFIYDIQYLLRMHIYANLHLSEDTMLLHHALHPEMNKGLGFLGSIYTNESSWKLLRSHRADTEKRDE